MNTDDIQDYCKELFQNFTKEVDKIVLEYMAKRGLTLDDLNKIVRVQKVPVIFDNSNIVYVYNDEVILTVKHRADITNPLAVSSELVIERGEW